MASIFRPAGRSKYRINYINGQGQRVVVPGYTDKKATEQLARQLERDAEREMAGLPVVAQARRQEPIQQILDEYYAEMQRLNRAAKHVYNQKRYLARIFASLPWPNLAAIRVDPFAAYLRSMQRSPRTVNGYRQAITSLMKFCCSRGWLEDNPFRHFSRVPSKKTRLRRSYTVEEFKRLCQTPNGELYFVAGLSGFRRGELAQLEKQDLSPHAQQPQWNPRPEITKARRRDVFPIHPDLLSMIRAIYDALPDQTSKLFPAIPCYRTFLRDLKTAEIAETDRDGRHADFHSLRYFYCTQLAKVMPIQEVQRMMRHANVTITSAVYNDLGISDLWARAQQLPSLGIAFVPPIVPLPEKPIISPAKQQMSS